VSRQKHHSWVCADVQKWCIGLENLILTA
jgi:hypothetical protein